MAIAVRQATLADVDDLALMFDAYRQFYKQSSAPEAARDFLRERFNHGESMAYLAYDGHVPVGFTQLYPSFSSVSMARVFILNDLFVAPTHRRKGVAKQLIDAATHMAQTLGAVRVSLSTAIDNKTAQATYEALGWQRDSVFCAYHFKI